MIVTLDLGNYQLNETIGASVQTTINDIQTDVGVDINRSAIFSGDCVVEDPNNPLLATGTIAEGEAKTCNIDNHFVIFT